MFKNLLAHLDQNLTKYEDTDDFASTSSGSCFEERGKIRVVEV